MKRQLRLIKKAFSLQSDLKNLLPFMKGMKGLGLVLVILIIQAILIGGRRKIRTRNLFGNNFTYYDEIILFFIGTILLTIGIYLAFVLIRAYKYYYNYIQVKENQEILLEYFHNFSNISKRSLANKLKDLLEFDRDIRSISTYKINYDLQLLKHLKELSNGKSDEYFLIFSSFIERKVNTELTEIKLSRVESDELYDLYKKIGSNAINENFHSEESVDSSTLFINKGSDHEKIKLVINFIKPFNFWGPVKIIIRLNNELLLQESATKDFSRTFQIPLPDKNLLFEFEVKSFKIINTLLKSNLKLIKNIEANFPYHLNFEIAGSYLSKDKTNQFGGLQLKVYKLPLDELN